MGPSIYYVRIEGEGGCVSRVNDLRTSAYGEEGGVPTNAYVRKKYVRHKLIPSIYAACVINPDKFTDAVSYSGPTYIAIRSMKHDSSTAFTHGHGLERLRSVDSFKTVMSTPDGQVKPIFIVASDGGRAR